MSTTRREFIKTVGAAIATSQKMANSVVRYLVLNHQVPGYRVFVVGMGNATVAAEGGTTAKHTSGGRVEISLLKNPRLRGFARVTSHESPVTSHQSPVVSG